MSHAMVPYMGGFGKMRDGWIDQIPDDVKQLMPADCKSPYMLCCQGIGDDPPIPAGSDHVYGPVRYRVVFLDAVPAGHVSYMQMIKSPND